MIRFPNSELTDWQAIEEVNSVLEQYYRGQIKAVQAINWVATITGANQTKHREARP